MTIDDLSRADAVTDNVHPMELWVEVHGVDRSTAVVRGSVRIVDEDGRAVRFGPPRCITAKGGVVAVDTRTGQFRYSPSVPARQVSRTSPHYADTVDTFSVEAVDGYGSRAEAHIVVDILPSDHVLSGAALIRPVSANGVLTCRIDASAFDGAALTFSLQNPSNPPGSTLESAFSQRGGMVTLDTHTGQFTVVPPICEAGADTATPTDRFVVTALDPRGHGTDITVAVRARLSVAVQTLGTVPGVQRGAVLVDDDWPLRFRLGRAPDKGTARVDRCGAYTYTRAAGRFDSAEDSFTILGADDHGRSMTVATVTVCPPLELPAGAGEATPSGAPAPPSAGMKTNTALGGAKEAQWYPITVESGCTLSIQSTSGGTSTLCAGPGGDHTLRFTSAAGSFFTRGPAGTVVLRATDAAGCHTDRTYSY